MKRRNKYVPGVIKLLCLSSVMMLFAAFLSAQENTWHVYRPGYRARDISCHNGDVWVASSAGIMHWNPTSDLRIQYDEYNTPYPDRSIACLCFGPDGALWAGGNHGLMRFEAGIWQLFNTGNSGLVNNSIRKIVADPYGGVWIGTDQGVSHYRQRVWTTFNSTNSTLPSSYDFQDLTLDPIQGVWIATTDAVHYYNTEAWTMYTSQNSTLPNYQVKSIAFEANGDGWFGLSSGVAKYTGGVWQRITSLAGLSIDEVKGSHTDPWGRVWMWSQDKLWLCDEGSSVSYPYQTFGTHYMNFTGMVMDEEQAMWLTFFDQHDPASLLRFDGTDYSRHPVSELPLASRNVQAIFRGFDDKLWIAASEEKENGGYFSIGEDGIQNFGKFNTDMPCYHVWALAQDRQLNVWVGTCIGLLKTGPSGSQVFHYEAGIGGGYLETICPVEDGVWIGNNQGVSRYTDGIWTPITTAEAGLNLAYTKVIKADNLGRIWIGSSAGVCCYADAQFTAYPQITGAKDFAFGENGEVWVARGELSRFQDDEWTHFNAGNSGFLENHVNCVAIDQNQVLWVGMGYSSSVSLYRFDGTNWTGFNSQNSPLTKGIKTIFVDEDNTKWIGSNYLYVFNEDGLPVSNIEELAPQAVSCVNYPNPFRESTTIRFEKRTQGPLHINIYNLKGQKVWSHTGIHSAKGEIQWDGKDKHGQNCATGLYLIQLQDKEGSRIHKALKLK